MKKNLNTCHLSVKKKKTNRYRLSANNVRTSDSIGAHGCHSLLRNPFNLQDASSLDYDESVARQESFEILKATVRGRSFGASISNGIQTIKTSVMKYYYTNM